MTEKDSSKAKVAQFLQSGKMQPLKPFLVPVLVLVLGLASIGGVLIWTMRSMENVAQKQVAQQQATQIKVPVINQLPEQMEQELPASSAEQTMQPGEAGAPQEPQDMQEPASVAKKTVVKKISGYVEDKIALTPAPVPDLTEKMSKGLLPRIADDGRKPWQVYSRPFTGGDKPRLALVVTQLGVGQILTTAAILRLPGSITLAFDAQDADLEGRVEQAREAGHEVLIDLPMEPFDYPRSDPGPGTLLTNLQPRENLSRLFDMMRRSTGYIGMTTTSGTNFLSSPENLKLVMSELNSRGLIFFDPRLAPLSAARETAKEIGMPFAMAYLRLDDSMTPEEIDAALMQLVQRATQAGKAVGVAVASPLMFDRINRWLRTLPDTGVVLAPLSAVVE